MLSIIELSYNEVACYLAILRWIPAKRTVLNDYDKVGCKLEPLVDATHLAPEGFARAVFSYDG